ncbi:MAG: bifunctional heptose 7-phosphate kinase/heptose 1-phosphate adenyltransferase, partial [Nitrospira sp.]
MGTIRKSDSVTKRSVASPPSADSNGKGDALSPKTLRQYLQRFPQASILVVGDLILDHYVMGRVSRISPEAPVPVVHVESESIRLGGAANVFNNILALGGKADLCGVIGSDESGRLLMKELGNKRSSRGGVVIDHDRPTTRKSRVIAHNQQIVRYDIEGRSELKVALRQKILRYVESRIRELSCIVVSDYAKGVVSPALMSDLIRLAALRKVPVIVDPKVEHFSYYKGVTVLTPNHLEAAQASGLHGD